MSPHDCRCDPLTHHRLVIVVADRRDGRGQVRDEWIALCDLCEPGRIALETRYVPRVERDDGRKSKWKKQEKPAEVTRMVIVSAMRGWPRTKPSVLEVHLDTDPIKWGREQELWASGYQGAVGR